MIGKVVKLDMNTDSKATGRLARLAVYVNLDRPLVSQIFIDGKVQRIEYEFLPTICFQCGKYWHLKESCPSRISIQHMGGSSNLPKKKLETEIMNMDVFT